MSKYNHPFSTQSSELFKEKRINRCPVKNKDCVLSWELDRNWGHTVLSPEFHGAYMGHPDLVEPGSVPICIPGTLGA